MTNTEKIPTKESQHGFDNFPEEGTGMSNENQEFKRSGISGLVFVGCLMIGFAIGFMTGNIPVGLFMGLGVGFIAMAITRYFTGSW